jgi:pimeloyl-ACP methyl ester carboxylesterase
MTPAGPTTTGPTTTGPTRTGRARPRRTRALAALLALATATATATACAQEADQDPSAGADTSSNGGGSNNDGGNSDGGNSDGSNNGGGDGSADDGSGTMDWQTCGGGAECAELEVPLDYDDPEGDTIPVSVARVPATGDRIGALFINPGGPGALATEYAVGIAFQLPSELTERFDIVGVDPRGLGSSDIDCGGDFAELYAVDYSIDSPEDEDELLSISQEYVDGCQEAAGDLLPHLGTENVARDIDAVREAMGDEQLNYLGFSYGTAIGQMMAELFPDRIRSIIIDGVVELGPTGVELADDQSLGFESALDAFVEDCDGDPSCPIGPDAEAAIDDLMALVEEEPVPASPRDLTPGTLAIGMAGPLYNEFAWPDLAQAVADALDGDGSGMVTQADQYLSSDFDVYFAVNCIDFAWPDTPEELLAAGAETAQEAPHFGEPIVNDYVRCSMWPAEGEPLPAVTAPEAPPILVVSTTNDPATPYEAGVRTAERLETGVLLTYEGEGHTAVASGVPCIDDIVVDYLVDLEVPEDETTC